MDTAVACQPRSRIRANAPLVASATAFLLVLGLTVLIGSRAVRGIYAQRSCPPSFDEAVHLLPAIQIANDLRRLDLAAFWTHSGTQDQLAYYPFFYSWMVAPFFLIWTPSLVVGRSTGIIFLSLSVVVGFSLAGELSPDKAWRWLAGLTGAGMMLAALPLWAYAGPVYIEAAGLLVSMCALYCYIKAGPDRVTPAWLIASSLFAAGALFAKYSFGVFMVGSLALSEILACLFTRRASLKRWLYLGTPFALLALFWFTRPGKLSGFWAYSHLQQANMTPWTVSSLIFYPRAFAQLYLPDALLVGLVVSGIILGLWQIRQHRYRAVLSYLLVGLAVLILVPQKTPRFLYTIAATAFVMGGGAAAWAASRLAVSLKSVRGRTCAVVLALLLLCIEVGGAEYRLSFLDAARESVYSSTADMGRAYRFVLEHTLARGIRPLMLNSWHAFNQYSLAWEYYSAQGGAAVVDTFELAAAAFAPEPTPANLDRLLQTLAAEGVGALVSIDGSPAGSFTSWQTVDALQKRGEAELVASSDSYAFVAWSDQYRARVFAGSFRNQAEFDAARLSGRGEFQIRLHVYRVLWDDLGGRSDEVPVTRSEVANTWP